MNDGKPLKPIMIKKVLKESIKYWRYLCRNFIKSIDNTAIPSPILKRYRPNVDKVLTIYTRYFDSNKPDRPVLWAHICFVCTCLRV